MTLRRTLHILTLATALSIGASALPVEAAPRVAAVPAVTQLGKDMLAVTANEALGFWSAYTASPDQKALDQFDYARDQVATEVALRIGLEPAAMQWAWATADRPHQLALLAALTQLGTPYRGYKRIPGVGFDCSGLTSWAWSQVGVELARNSRNQIRNAAPVERGAQQAGDLVYYPGHVMMSLGVGDAIVHAPTRGRTVELGFVAKYRAKSARFGNPLG